MASTPTPDRVLYWRNFYEQQNETTKTNEASSFCQFVVKEKYLQSTDVVMEWGCGNGRDANALSSHCEAVFAVDIAKSPHPSNFNALNLKHMHHTDFTDLRLEFR